MPVKNHHLCKPVQMRNPITKHIVRRFNSMGEAVKEMDILHYRLIHAIKTKTEWDGYLWEYAPKEEDNNHVRP